MSDITASSGHSRLRSRRRTFETLSVDQVSDPEQMLTTAQAAKVLGVSARTLARYVERGQLTPTVVLPSGHYRWLLSDIRAQLRELRQRPSDGV